MTQSELMAVMTGGFATVAGGVMAAYVFMLQGHFTDIAGHLISASVMSAPAALVCAKLLVPEPVPEKSETFGELKVELEKIDVNVIDAAARGAGDGLKLALNVGAMLLAFIALIAMFNGILGWSANCAADVVYGPTWEERVRDAHQALQEQLDQEPLDPEALQDVAHTFAVLAQEALGLADLQEVVVEIGRNQPAAWEDDGKLHLAPEHLDPQTPAVAGILPELQSESPYRGGVAQAADVGFEGSLRTASFQALLGWLLWPLAWLMGVPSEDAHLVGQLIGIKTVLNEFVAYGDLAGMLSSGQFTHSRSVVIAVYALCGFANFGSIAIQIGGIGDIAPNRKHDLARLGLKAMIGGTVAALLTACVAGVLI